MFFGVSSQPNCGIPVAMVNVSLFRGIIYVAQGVVPVTDEIDSRT